MTTSPVMGITEEILGEIERAGWKLVPVEPTPEMIERSQYWHRCREPQVPPENFRGFYDALIAAAPPAAERDALRAEVESLREIREIASQCAANGGYLCSRDLIELRELLKK